MDSILNINLSNARGKDEDFTTYKNRLKTNKRILKLYKTYGREAFQAMFPNGVSEALENSEIQRQFHHENNPEVVDNTNNTNKTTYQSKVNKSQNVNSKATTQTRKSGRGK
jgi:hypothetical protein